MCERSKNISSDKTDAVVVRLLEAFKAYYDVVSPYEYEQEQFDGYAEFHSYGEKYVLSKKAKLWEVSAHEYVFFKKVEGITPLNLAFFLDFMTQKAICKVKPEPDHMSSDISLVIITEHLNEHAAKLIRKYRWRKNHGFLGLRGWSDLRLVVADVSNASVVTNAAGKKLRDTVQSNVNLGLQDNK